jgi:XapX domain-containing protein
MSYILSLLAGIAVGVAYALVGVRSPAPPLIALIGLLGIVLGETGTTMLKETLDRSAAPTAASTRH